MSGLAVVLSWAIPVISLIPSATAQSALDIRSFGARCDGSDDTGAVQSALNAIPVGGTLNFSCQAGIRQVSLSNRSNITITGSNGGGVKMLTETGDVWSRAFSIYYCSGCTIRDMVFEGNNKDIIPFNIEESSNTTVSGLTIRNVKHAGAAFLALHNNGNKYLNNNVQNVGMDRGPIVDTTRGIWVGNVSDALKETNVTISGNTLIDISGTAIASHGSGMTITNNTGIRLNASCVKALPLGGSGSTLIANNNCSGASAKYWIGGGMMTEYPNSSYENTVIRDNVLEGFAAGDVGRILDCPNNGLGIANPVGKTTHNIQVLNNTFRNFLYDSIQVTGPTDNFVIEGNIIERTISTGDQWGGIAIQGDSGKVYTNGVIRRNMIRGKFDAINLGGNGGAIRGLTVDNNSVTSTRRDGVHIEVLNGGDISSVTMTNNCFSAISGTTIWDNRSGGFPPAPQSPSCSDPTSSFSITSPGSGQTVSGAITLQASGSGSATIAGVQFKIDGANYGSELLSQPWSMNWDSRTVGNGTHQITAEARYSTGTRATSPAVSVTVSNTVADTTPPSASITSPSSGQTVSGTFTLAASGNDNAGVVSMQFRLNGTALGPKTTTAPFTMSWDTRTVANGTYQLTAVAQDAVGNTGTSAAVSVVVSNGVTSGDTSAPNVAVTSPSSGSTVSGTTTCTATASDNVGVAGVQFMFDGAPYGAELTSAPYTMSWNSSNTSNGSHTITAVARDAAGNKTTSGAVTVTVSNGAASTLRINAGGPAYTDPSGTQWAADYGFNGGYMFVPDLAVASTNAPVLYQSQRWNDKYLSYDLPVANGNYNLTLKFAELYFSGAGQRVFDVVVNGQTVLPNFDIVAQAGTAVRAIDKTFPVSVTNGSIKIEMTSSVDDPAVNAIEVAPATAADTTVPTVAVTSPSNGQTVSGPVNMTASASDNKGISSLQFKLNGSNLGAALTTAPYSLAWDSRTVANGSYQLSAVAVDAAGNSGTSATVSVTVANADTTVPTVSITSPTSGQTKSGSFAITASASDNIGVASVQFKMNGANLGSAMTTAPYSMTWDSGTVANGTYQFTAVAVDAAGNSATSAAVSVVVSNADTTVPTVSITSPTSGQTKSGSFAITASASDNIGVTSVQFKMNGANLGSAMSAAPYSMTWDSRTVANGTYQFTAVAVDAAGNSATSAAVSVVVSNADTTVPTVSITSPTSGQTKSGSFAITANASDNIGVTSVQFKMNGANVGSAMTTAPYSMTWDSRTVANGTYQFTAVAVDTAGNSATSAAVSVVVSNADTTAPTVAVTSPAAGVTVTGAANLTATASDNIGVAGVQFVVDGANYGAELTAAPYAINWNSAAVANGSHTIAAVARDAAGNKKTSAAVTITVSNVVTPSLPTIRINAGGPAYTDPTGKQWAADAGFSGGHVYAPGYAISNTATPVLYSTQRWNNKSLTYQFSVPNGAYSLNLKFAEMYFSGTGQRVFSIAVNGQTVLANFDIVAQAGGSRRAVDKLFPVNVTGGKITIVLTASVDDPAVNAIEITPASQPSASAPVQTVQPAIRINAGGPALTDASGVLWSEDSGFNGGYAWVTNNVITNTSNPAPYQSLRWNNNSMAYQFDVANKTYTVNLKFAELYFTTAGMRVFNVRINGQTVLSSFDIVAQAGGPNRAIDKAFQVNVTDGKILIQLDSSVEDPQINGIEIY
jgi:hypothetical protein